MLLLTFVNRSELALFYINLERVAVAIAHVPEWKKITVYHKAKLADTFTANVMS